MSSEDNEPLFIKMTDMIETFSSKHNVASIAFEDWNRFLTEQNIESILEQLLNALNVQE